MSIRKKAAKRKTATKKKVAKKSPAPKKAAKKNAGGRPSSYSESVAAKICESLAQGKSLRTVCKGKGMPNASTVFVWLSKHPKFQEQYARAKEASADAMGEEILDISDDASNDWMEKHGKDGDVGYILNGEHVQRSRLRIDSRKWLMSKMKSKKYGDKLDVTTRDETPPVTRESMVEMMRKSPSYLAQVEAMVAEAKQSAS